MTRKKTEASKKATVKKPVESKPVDSGPLHAAVILNVKWGNYLKNEIVPDPDGNLVKAGVARPYNPDSPEAHVATEAADVVPEELSPVSDELVDSSEVDEPESDPDPWAGLADLEERFK